MMGFSKESKNKPTINITYRVHVEQVPGPLDGIIYAMVAVFLVYLVILLGYLEA